MIAPVVLLRHVANARRQAAIDVVVEARDARVPAGLRPLARPVREDAVQHVERLAHLLRVRVGAEVPDALPVPLAREHHARVLVLDRDRDVRERLVVAQAHVERRAVPFHEVLLQVKRFDLAAGDDHLDVVDPVRAAAGSARARRPSAGSSCARAGAAISPCRHRAPRRACRGTGRRPGFAGSYFNRSSSRAWPSHGYRSQADARCDLLAAPRPPRRSAGAAGGPGCCSGRPRTTTQSTTLAPPRRRWTCSAGGLHAVRVTQVWAPGAEVPPNGWRPLENAVERGKVDGVKVV